MELEPRASLTKKSYFWANPYKIAVMKTPIQEILELPNFGYISISTI